MCRLYGFMANEPTKVECTLVYAQNALLHQSRKDLKGHSHSDGWGICCYPNGTPHRKRRAAAAHEDLWFSTTAERTYSHAVIAHVRRATVGGAELANTHPFVCGCWTFAHNGTLLNFDQLEPRLLAEISPKLRAKRLGKTDSELIFLWLMSQLIDRGISLSVPCNNAAMLKNLVGSALVRLNDRSQLGSSDETSQLNILLTDGRVMLATCWNRTLYYAKRIGVHDCEICGIPHIRHNKHAEYRAYLVASEPISHETWQKLPNHSLLLMDSNLHVQLQKLGA